MSNEIKKCLESELENFPKTTEEPPKLYPDRNKAQKGIEDVFEEITGRTKAEDDNYQKEEKDKREKQKKEPEEAMPELTKKWIDAGHKVLDKSVWEWWDRIVPIRLGDLYQGMELSCCLDIISALNSGVSFEVANEIFDKQGHSGMSYSLVKSMVYKCGDKGKKFVEWLVVKESV